MGSPQPDHPSPEYLRDASPRILYSPHRRRTQSFRSDVFEERDLAQTGNAKIKTAELRALAVARLSDETPSGRPA